MSLKQVTNPPTFDPKRPHGEIYGSGEDSSVARARFCQDGHYYTGDHSYVGSDASAKKVAREPAAAPQGPDPGTKTVSEAEVDELLKMPKAATLMSYPLPALAAMVKQAGGPAYSGDNAPKLYTAWLLKFVKDPDADK